MGWQIDERRVGLEDQRSSGSRGWKNVDKTIAKEEKSGEEEKWRELEKKGLDLSSL